MKNVLFLFGQLGDRDVEWLTAQGTPRRVPAGTTLVVRGRALDAVYVILEGRFAVIAGGGREIARMTAGEVFGEMSFVDASPPSADVRAVEDSMVLTVPRASLQGRLEADPGFAARFYRAVAMMLSHRLREAHPREAPAKDGVLEYEELDPNVMDGVSQAGDRFREMVKQAKARA